MQTDTAAYDSYDAMEIAVPVGPIDVPMADSRIVRCAPLPLKRAVYWLRVLDRAQLGDSAAFMRIVDEFPKEVGIEDVDLTVAEAFDVLRRFCFCRRREPSGMKKGQAPEASSSALTT